MTIPNADIRQVVVQDAPYLESLPDHLRSRFLEGFRDPTLTHLRRQIALTEVRVKLLLETLDRKVLTVEKITADLREEFPELEEKLAQKIAEYLFTFLPEGYIDQRSYRSMERLAGKYKTAMADGRMVQANGALNQLFATISAGRRDDATWHEIETVMDNQRKLAEAEERRLVANQQMLSIEAVAQLQMALIYGVKEALLRYVPDRETQSYILAEAKRLSQGLIAGPVSVGPDGDSLG